VVSGTPLNPIAWSVFSPVTLNPRDAQKGIPYFFRNSTTSYLESFIVTYYIRTSLLRAEGNEGYERVNICGKEDQMSKKKVLAWVTVLSLLLLVCATNQAIGKEKTVVLNVPACSSWPAVIQRIGSILRSIDGVVNVAIDRKDATARVTFDDTKTDVKKIVETLESAGYPVTGEPQFVE
jgi:copper chaperone CopZ